jgi:hypothetical protein
MDIHGYIHVWTSCFPHITDISLDTFVLDLTLFNQNVESSQPVICRKLCAERADQTQQIEEKLFAQSATFLLDVDSPKQIRNYMAQFTRCRKAFAQVGGRLQQCTTQYIDNLYANCTISEPATGISSS